MRRLIDAAHTDVTDLLVAHRDQLDSLTSTLLTAETLDQSDAYAAARVPLHDSTPVAMLDVHASRNGGSPR